MRIVSRKAQACEQVRLRASQLRDRIAVHVRPPRGWPRAGHEPSAKTARWDRRGALSTRKARRFSGTCRDGRGQATGWRVVVAAVLWAMLRKEFIHHVLTKIRESLVPRHWEMAPSQIT